jgi:hypothetical protein
MVNSEQLTVNNFFRIFFLSFCCFASMGATDGGSYAPNSALESGKWVKIQVGTTGVYKITDDDLKKMGFADPAKVSLHGYGGWPLDEDFSRAYTDDLPAVAVYRGSNYLLFYGKGPVKWEYNAQTNTFVHTNNPYSTQGYYFLTDRGETKEMQTLASASAGASLAISSYDEYRVFEEDLVSVNASGRELFGESFAGGGTHTLNSAVFRIPGITGEAGKIAMRFIARPRSTQGLATLSIDGNPLLNLSFPAVSSSDTYNKAVAAANTVAWEGEKSETPGITLGYNKAGDENVHLDYIRLHVKRSLQQYGEYTLFRSLASQDNVSRFVIRNANENTLVFDVTDGINPKRMETQLSGSELSFTVPAGALREFAAVQANQTLGGWKSAGEVRNQNLHALPQADMVIIVQDALRSQAERLAEKHRTADNLRVQVVSPQQIYNEFSSGTPDATACRRFMKMFYDRAASEADRPKYLLLFGDGAFDNRLLTTAWKEVNTANMLPTYQSENSLNQYSYVTDDYFGALGNEPFGTGAIQLGVGRFPVRTPAEAAVTVDKVIGYMDNAPAGAWKNRICFVADDGSALDGFSNEHMQYADRLGERIKEEHPGFLVNKIYFDTYRKSASKYPDVRQNIQKQLKDGLLVINYTGHGSTEKWSDEDVLTVPDIAGFTHTNLPLWITATCDFTRFDAAATSAGENVFLQKSGGIAMFTTTRVVYSNNNFELNNHLIGELFSRDAEGRRLALGDVIRRTKGRLFDSNKLNFILIGDPAMKLAYPEYRMQVTTINGEPPAAPASFKALEKITVGGNVLLPNENTVASDFSGSLNVTVLDSKQTVRTLDNNHTGEVFTFTDYPNALYVGNDRVNNGRFEFSFTVPKDISYSNDYGLMNLYAAAGSPGTEAQGYFSDFLVGGSSERPEEDAEGPEIRRLYLNDSTFRDGGKVNTTPLFVARLWDKSGVNISGSSIGHDVMLSIDNKPALSYNLNAYYQLLPETEGEGRVVFPIPALEPGMHTAEFRVWDVANNPTLRTFTFEVSEGVKPGIDRVVATPVPARESVRFLIYHNRPESALQVSVSVYDMTGRLQWHTQTSASSGIGMPCTVEWNLTSSSGSRLRPGVYVYRAAIRTAGTAEAARSGKLVLLAQ